MATKRRKKEWVVMIYMAADNDLSDESVWALTEIQKVGLSSNSKIGVIALFDSRLQGFKTTAFEFGYGDTELGVLPGQGSNRVEDLGDFDSDPSSEVLRKFVSTVQERFPAEHYILILSGHGSGAVGDFLKSGDSFTGMSIPALGEKLADACKQDIDILGMDSCVMSMVEVCCQMPDEIKFLVGSEGYDPMIGWPYQAVISDLESKLKKGTYSRYNSQPEVLRKEVAEGIVNSYITYYQPYIAAGTSVDISACDLNEDKKRNIDKKASLMEAVGKLAEELNTRLTDQVDEYVLDAVILAHWWAQSYKKETYTDLWDFCVLLEKYFDTEDAVYKACGGVKNAIAGMVTASRYYGPSFQHSHGLSIYFPWRESKELSEYGNLKFSVGTTWGEFLRRYLETSRREKRGEVGKGIFLPDSEEVLIPAMEEGAGVLVQMNNKLGGPPDRLGGPPDRLGGPPDRLGGPPDRLGVLAKSASMKNPPNGFLVDKNTKDEITKPKKAPVKKGTSKKS